MPRPELTSIKIMPEIFKAGDTLYVDVVGSDIDGDEVTILYEWTKMESRQAKRSR